MASMKTEIEKLGTIHKKYNEKVLRTLSKEDKNFFKVKNLFTSSASDLDNLMKIDIACSNRDLDYALSVLKCNDMLYVSRVINQCPWLVDDRYAHVINLENLEKHIFPSMMTKARIKLLKYLQKHLKNERAEEFYLNETNFKSANKWLLRCSIPFIENNIGKHMKWRATVPNVIKKTYYGPVKTKKYITLQLTPRDFKRFCEISVTIFERAVENLSSINGELLKAASFLLQNHANVYLNVVERKFQDEYPLKFNKKVTKLILKKCPERITNKPEVYFAIIDVPTFVDRIEAKDTRDFLFENAGNGWFNYDVARHFVLKLPKSDQYELVKELFIQKPTNVDNEEMDIFCSTFCLENPLAETPEYHWYKFAPFETAFSEIKELIQNETSPTLKRSMFLELITIAGNDTNYLLSVLNDDYLKEDAELRQAFIYKLFSKTDFHKYDDILWEAIEKVIAFDKDTLDPKHDRRNYFYKASIVRNILRYKAELEFSKEGLKFDTLAEFKNRLSSVERQLVFDMLYNQITDKFGNLQINDEKSLQESVAIVENALELLKGWDKNITDYPKILQKVKSLVKFKKERSYKTDLSCLYDKNKCWKKYMFEESLDLQTNEETLLNTLKHKPERLENYNSVLMNAKQKVRLRKLLQKLRIYYTESLAKNWIKNIYEGFSCINGHKTLIQGLFTLLPKEQLSEMVKKYAPNEPNWENVDDRLLSIQMNIAKNLHLARPQLHTDLVLLYAKGDYVNFSLQPILTLLKNNNDSYSKEITTKLINSSKFVKKQGLAAVVQKVDHSEIIECIKNGSNIENSALKAVIYEQALKLLTSEKDKVKIKELCKILGAVVENLTFEEHNKFYTKHIWTIRKVPPKIRAPFLVKVYKLLNTFNSQNNSEKLVKKKIEILIATLHVIDYLDPDFAEDVIKKYYFNENNDFFFMSKYVIGYIQAANKEETIQNRYEKLLIPIVAESLEKWDDEDKNSHIRNRFKTIMASLNENIKNRLLSSEYGLILEDTFYENKSNNYINLTAKKLRLKLTELTTDFKDLSITKKTGSETNYPLEILKEDIHTYSPDVYKLFVVAMTGALNLQHIDTRKKLIAYKNLLYDKDCLQGYLSAILLLSSHYHYRDNEKLAKEIKETIRTHPSEEIKMHFYYKFAHEYEVRD